MNLNKNVIPLIPNKLLKRPPNFVEKYYLSLIHI